MTLKSDSERLAEMQQHLASLKLHLVNAPMQLELIKKERETLDAKERVIRNLQATAPARIVQIEADIRNLIPFDNTSSFAKKQEQRAKMQIALGVMLKTIESLPKDSAMRATLIKEVEAVMLELR